MFVLEEEKIPIILVVVFEVSYQLSLMQRVCPEDMEGLQIFEAEGIVLNQAWSWFRV